MNWRSRSFKVINFCCNRKPIYVKCLQISWEDPMIEFGLNLLLHQRPMFAENVYLATNRVWVGILARSDTSSLDRVPCRPSNCRRLANMVTSGTSSAVSTVRITALIKRQPSWQFVYVPTSRVTADVDYSSCTTVQLLFICNSSTALPAVPASFLAESCNCIAMFGYCHDVVCLSVFLWRECTVTRWMKL